MLTVARHGAKAGVRRPFRAGELLVAAGFCRAFWLRIVMLRPSAEAGQDPAYVKAKERPLGRLLNSKA